MREWPDNCPEDLKRRLEEVLSFRRFETIELYRVFADWAEANGVAPPAPKG